MPLSGVPRQEISDLRGFQHVGIVGDDYVGMKPTMQVQVGDRVLKGQCLFEDKNNAGVRFTAPATGTVTAIERGEKRKFESLAIEVDWNSEQQETFDCFVRFHKVTCDV